MEENKEKNKEKDTRKSASICINIGESKKIEVNSNNYVDANKIELIPDELKEKIKNNALLK